MASLCLSRLGYIGYINLESDASGDKGATTILPITDQLMPSILSLERLESVRIIEVAAIPKMGPVNCN